MICSVTGFDILSNLTALFNIAIATNQFPKTCTCARKEKTKKKKKITESSNPVHQSSPVIVKKSIIKLKYFKHRKFYNTGI